VSAALRRIGHGRHRKSDQPTGGGEPSGVSPGASGSSIRYTFPSSPSRKCIALPPPDIPTISVRRPRQSRFHAADRTWRVRSPLYLPGRRRWRWREVAEPKQHGIAVPIRQRLAICFEDTHSGVGVEGAIRAHPWRRWRRVRQPGGVRRSVGPVICDEPAQPQRRDRCGGNLIPVRSKVGSRITNPLSHLRRCRPVFTRATLWSTQTTARVALPAPDWWTIGDALLA
jgi:hypothetical protein